MTAQNARNELSWIDYVNPEVEISIVTEKIDASGLVQQVYFDDPDQRVTPRRWR